MPYHHDCALVGKMKSYDQTHQIDQTDLTNQIDHSVAAPG